MLLYALQLQLRGHGVLVSRKRAQARSHSITKEYMPCGSIARPNGVTHLLNENTRSQHGEHELQAVPL
jgi:hypothetical protein